MIGEGCYEKHMRRDAVTSNVTVQVYARVRRCTHVIVHAHTYETHANIHTHREAADYEATSAETSYSDNCYYRVTGLIRSIKCKGRRSKSYEYPCTIPTCPSHAYYRTVVCPPVLPSVFFKTAIAKPRCTNRRTWNSRTKTVTSSRQTFRMTLRF